MAIPLLSLLYPVKEAVTLYLFFQLVEIFLIAKSYKNIHWKSIKKVTPPTLVFALLGSLSLNQFSESTLRLTLGGVILAYLSKELFWKDFRLAKSDSLAFGFITGSLGGWLQGLLGTGGPAFLIYYNELKLDKSKFRASILLLAFSCNVLRFFSSLGTGLITESLFFLFLSCSPVVLLALYLGSICHQKISQSIYRKLTFLVLLVSALSLMLGR